MKEYKYEQLKCMDSVDKGINYESFENTITCENLWVYGVVRSEVKTWSCSISICVRLFNKNNENIAGINLMPGQKLIINELSGYIEVKKTI